MKPGDLVMTINGLGLELYSDDCHPLGIQFRESEIGTILIDMKVWSNNLRVLVFERKKQGLPLREGHIEQGMTTLVKVIVPQGIGWCFTDWLKVV
jgi:hypothetical protein